MVNQSLQISNTRPNRLCAARRWTIGATSLLGDHSGREPPDPIPNSEVKPFSADDSVAVCHAKVGNRQALNPKKPKLAFKPGFFFCHGRYGDGPVSRDGGLAVSCLPHVSPTVLFKLIRYKKNFYNRHKTRRLNCSDTVADMRTSPVCRGLTIFHTIQSIFRPSLKILECATGTQADAIRK